MNSTFYEQEIEINTFFTNHMYVFSLLLILLTMVIIATQIGLYYLCFIYLKKQSTKKEKKEKKEEMIEMVLYMVDEKGEEKEEKI